MKGFRDALMDAGKFYAHLDVHWEEIHDRWNEHLGDLGLDPELFRYQREMNADEGEAAGLFAVKKDSDFTDLLLRAVTDTRDTDGLADLVSGFGNKLGRRAELTAKRDFTAGSVDLLGRIVEATDARAGPATSTPGPNDAPAPWPAASPPARPGARPHRRAGRTRHRRCSTPSPKPSPPGAAAP
ncbi:hypothetical protein SBADM41S_11733 [Streptomyces badius]